MAGPTLFVATPQFFAGLSARPGTASLQRPLDTPHPIGKRHRDARCRVVAHADTRWQLSERRRKDRRNGDRRDPAGRRSGRAAAAGRCRSYPGRRSCRAPAQGFNDQRGPVMGMEKWFSKGSSEPPARSRSSSVPVPRLYWMPTMARVPFSPTSEPNCLYVFSP